MKSIIIAKLFVYGKAKGTHIYGNKGPTRQAKAKAKPSTGPPI
jgi:hypothetical protein